MLLKLKMQIIGELDCVRGSENNIMKTLITPRLIYRFDVIPIKIPAGSFEEIAKLISKFMWKLKGSKKESKQL